MRIETSEKSYRRSIPARTKVPYTVLVRIGTLVVLMNEH